MSRNTDRRGNKKVEHLNKKYLKILAKQYPNERSAATEIINLQSILCLPKATEHFISDVHGEYEQFHHVLKNGSGAVRRKIDEVIGNTLTNAAKRELATLIYYPREKLEIIKQKEEDLEDWFFTTLHRLIQVLKSVSSKYTRSKVRKAIPEGYVYVVEELITEKAEVQNKEAYYNQILQTIVRIGDAEAVIEVLCNLIHRLTIDHLHIVGDIFDRGPGPHYIMDTLCEYHSLDIQWGNHDILWMGAASGNLACIANVLRISVKYGNLEVLEDGYGINILPLATFALDKYKDVDCHCFELDKNSYDSDMHLRIYKAITMIQLKLEGQIIINHPEFEMNGRLLLDKINFETKTITIDGREYRMKDIDFPTVDKNNPYILTKEETEVMERLKQAFYMSEKLQKHIRFLFDKGHLYKIYNGNLLFHGCIPMDEQGEFQKLKINQQEYGGKALYDIIEKYVRRGFFADSSSRIRKIGGDYMWYLWNGPKSPLFGRSKMSTFERLFIDDDKAAEEDKNTYYSKIDDKLVIEKIFNEFGLNMKTSHIINGHVPVIMKKGETPIHCDGKLLQIDGGFSKPYHKKTGIAGYTLVSNSKGMSLVMHENFESADECIKHDIDIVSDTLIIEKFLERKSVGDTDIGSELRENIEDLEELLFAYRTGDASV